MITTFTSEFPVASLADTVTKATEVWREFSGDPVAELHWSAIASVHRDQAGACTATVTIKVTDQDKQASTP